MLLSGTQLQEGAGVGQIYFSTASQGNDWSLDIKELYIFLGQRCQPEENGAITQLTFLAHLFGAFRNGGVAHCPSELLGSQDEPNVPGDCGVCYQDCGRLGVNYGGSQGMSGSAPTRKSSGEGCVHLGTGEEAKKGSQTAGVSTRH